METLDCVFNDEIVVPVDTESGQAAIRPFKRKMIRDGGLSKDIVDLSSTALERNKD